VYRKSNINFDKDVKMKILMMICLLGTFSFKAISSEINAKVTLDPAGSFDAKNTKVNGKLTVKGNEISADKISVNIKDFRTGDIPLRDDHFWEYLKGKSKSNDIVVKDVKGKDNKGTATITINDVAQKIEFSYKIEGKKATTKLTLDTKKFQLPKKEYMGISVDEAVEVEITIDTL
jgi:hypothetical protein